MNFLSDSFTISKRLLGVVLFFGGAGGFALLMLRDSLSGATDGGIGPAQQSALVLCALVALIGLTLIPLGRKPA
jgi:hypothetical protein